MEHLRVDEQERFVVELEGFSGPLELLLALARSQKIDLARISMLALAEQYLCYLEEARRRRIALAAEYLVMAAWLACLKSQLLLPPEEREEELDAEAEAEALRARLRRLALMRKAAEALAMRPQLEIARFPRGAPEARPIVREQQLSLDLWSLLRAHLAVATRNRGRVLALPRRRLPSPAQFLERIARLLTGGSWRRLDGFLPRRLGSELERRAALAAALVASLELARRGAVELHQPHPFGPVLLRRRS